MIRSFHAWLGLSLLAHGAAFAFALVGAHRTPTPLESAASSPTLTGDTLDVPGLEAVVDESAVDLDSEPVPAPSSATESDARSAARKPPRPRSRLVVRGAPKPSSDGESSGDSEPARFGAVGERGAVDLATAFTRGFPQAASADPIWTKAPFGSAGSVDVVLTIDEAGHLVEARLEPGGTPALRQALSRTIALIRGRTFTAKTRSATRLRVAGVVTADAVRNEGRVGDVFAIGGSYVRNSGSAFFSLAIGRRIDVTITDR